MGHDTERQERLAAFERRLKDEANSKERAKDEKKRARLEAGAARRDKAKAARIARARAEQEAKAKRAAAEQAKLSASDDFAQ